MTSFHRRIVLAVGATLIAHAGITAQSPSSPPTYRGTLDPDLVEVGYTGQAFTPATPADLARLPGTLDSASRAWVGTFRFSDDSDQQHPLQKALPAIAIVTPNKPDVLYVNVNGDSLPAPFTDKDKYVFTPSTVKPVLSGDQETRFVLPLPGTVFHGYPVRVIDSPRRAPDTDTEYYLFVRDARVQGTITLGGHPTLAQFEVSPITGKVRTLGTFSLDVTRNGAIEPYSRTENQYRWDPRVPIMFKVGDTYVTPGTVDERAGTFTMRGLTAREYVPAMDTGVTLANFAFGTLDGATRHLSDYRGKYVLLDFWTISCGPCIRAMPDLEAAYLKYHDRGFDIVGVNLDEHLDVQKFNDFLTQQKSTWTHTSVSVKPMGPALEQYINLHCRIHSYPTTVLIGPTGKIVAMDDDLAGQGLQRMLERLLSGTDSTSKHQASGGKSSAP